MLTIEQQEILLKKINPVRIAKRSGPHGIELKYIESWDVKAHLNRIFGFCGWSWEVLSAELAYEYQAGNNWAVGYKIIGRLSIHSTGAVYTEACVGPAQLSQRGEAHDMAVKTGESDCIKRAAINLGDQFGLSLYNNGSEEPVVIATLIGPETGESNE